MVRVYQPATTSRHQEAEGIEFLQVMESHLMHPDMAARAEIIEVIGGVVAVVPIEMMDVEGFGGSAEIARAREEMRAHLLSRP